MGFVKEFKEFAVKGNVLDLAVGVIIGGAFGKIVSSLVSDIIMPPVGLLLGKVDFSQLFMSLDGNRYATFAEAKKAQAPTLNYGQFLLNTLDFVLIAFVVFLLVKFVNNLRRPKPVPESDPVAKECPFCISSIPIKAARCPHCTSELPA